MTIKTLSAVLLATLFAVTTSATAGQINIILSDMDVTYSGSTTSLYDSTGKVGNNQTPAEADEVETAVFELDGNNVTTLMSDIGHELFGDLLIDNMPASLPLGSYQVGIGNSGGGYGFNLFSNDGASSTSILSLGIGTIDAIISPGVFFFTASATVLSQDLPGGLQLDPNVVISYTATLPAVQLGSTTNMAIASGAMTISGLMAVPEPTTLGLLVIGMGLACGRRSVR